MRLTNLESRAFVALVLIITGFFLWMIRAFLLPIFWAVVFAVLFRPMYQAIHRSVGGRSNLAAFLATVAVILVVGVPSGLLVTALAQQAVSVYERIATGQLDLQAPIAFAESKLPLFTDLLARYGIEVAQIRQSLQTAAVSSTQWFASQAVALGQNTLTVAVLTVLMLYILFFFFRDGDRIVAGLIRALPMGDEREKRLFSRFADVSRATVKGTLVVAVVQGALGGILFALVGLQAAVFWGVIMGVFSLLPAVGPALVWVPASIYFFAVGELLRGIIVFAGGALVVGLVDNLLRPVLVGRTAQLPDYVVLLATLGGLSVFGIAGFVAGPVIAALFLVMWEMFAEEYAEMDVSSIPTAPGGTVSAPDPGTRAAQRAGPDVRPHTDRVDASDISNPAERSAAATENALRPPPRDHSPDVSTAGELRGRGSEESDLGG